MTANTRPRRGRVAATVAAAMAAVAAVAFAPPTSAQEHEMGMLPPATTSASPRPAATT